jgi:hypothetical protein
MPQFAQLARSELSIFLMGLRCKRAVTPYLTIIYCVFKSSGSLNLFIERSCLTLSQIVLRTWEIYFFTLKRFHFNCS